MTATLAGRTALVVGAGRGIGRAVARALAGDGAAVAVTYANDADAAEQTVELIRTAGGVARAYRLAAESHEQAETVVASAGHDLGTVDILVNNGAVGSPGVSVLDTDPDDAHHLVMVNVLGPFYVSRAVLPGMRSRGRGDIVMISSRATVEPSVNRAAYAMSKAAVESLACSLALEERQHGIRVNTVAPGFVDTEIGRAALLRRYGIANPAVLESAAPFGRFCSVDDVANAIRYLLSDAGAYLTAQRIGVDGGGTSELFRAAGS